MMVTHLGSGSKIVPKIGMIIRVAATVYCNRPDRDRLKGARTGVKHFLHILRPHVETGTVDAHYDARAAARVAPGGEADADRVAGFTGERSLH
eukprot:1580782-Amphidinium_carterae.7